MTTARRISMGCKEINSGLVIGSVTISHFLAD